LIESSHPEQFSYRRVARGSYEPQKQIFAISSLLARIGAVRLAYKLLPAPPNLPPQQRAQIDALGPARNVRSLGRAIHPSSDTKCPVLTFPIASVSFP